MSGFDLWMVLNLVKNATSAVHTANAAIAQFKAPKAVITSDVSQADVNKALAQLREEYEALHERVQNKLRGTSS